jgi:cytochrome c-type biogenesis protein CcmH
MKYLHALVLLIAFFTGAPSWAVQSDEVLSDPALEARARAISKELRCMVCQNESIDDSEAPLAHDLRVLVRERLKAGDSDQQIINFLVSRYGEFVLLRPPLSWHTMALWGTPPTLVMFGIIMIVVVERRRRATSAQTVPPNLTAAEEMRLAELLRGDAGTPG